MIPNREKGARDERFLSKQSGSKIVDVIPNREAVLLNTSPKEAKIALNVSAKIMEYASVAHTVMKVQLMDGILLLAFPTLFSHA